jgi:hypothetical protein
MTTKVKIVLVAVGITIVVVGTVAVITLKPKRDEKTLEEYMGVESTTEVSAETTTENPLDYNSSGEKYINPFESSDTEEAEPSAESETQVGMIKNDTQKTIHITGQDENGVWSRDIDFSKYYNADWVYKNIVPNTDSAYTADFTFKDNPDLVKTTETVETLTTIKSIYKDNYTIDIFLDFDETPDDLVNSYAEECSGRNPKEYKLSAMEKNSSKIIAMESGNTVELFFVVTGEESGISYSIRYQGDTSYIGDMVDIINKATFK